ncbi:MAG: iron-containing alcohol dehydrogenase [Deltaproteobacteria bacterium]|jgi:NADP-dependent alcohol dehydrogenase|nr:iron-containing alcohol dehydrogenase [Deltaproteobacteria bacterium]
MHNFEFYNPVRIIFGKNSIKKIPNFIDKNFKILLTYGGGSIKENFIYEEVKNTLANYNIVEFGGIEPNPKYETLMKAVKIARNESIDFILAVGGGSVIDGTKFISAAIDFDGDPWDILSRHASVKSAVPFGTILTIAATGSEMNEGAVISCAKTNEKLVFKSEKVFPQFSILDPQTTFTLPKKQTVNGIVDAFIHVLEQYLTKQVNSPLQDKQAEAVLKTIIEESPKVLENPKNYEARANIMWCATNALNRTLGVGVVQDWSTHMIAHELTALFKLDHARALSLILPSLLRIQKEEKADKLYLYGKEIWNLKGTKNTVIKEAINKTEEFFRNMDVKTRISEYDIPQKELQIIPALFKERGIKLGENKDIDAEKIAKILENAY